MMSVTFQPFLARSSDYPKVRVATSASLSFKYLKYRASTHNYSAFISNGEFFIQGRYALIEAMQRANVKKGSIVLLPSFHCRSMVEPALFLGADIYFYQVLDDLRPDFSRLSSILENKDRRPAVMILTHYFGFPNAVTETKLFCKLRNITLIEDCAHAIYSQYLGQPLGTSGNYAIASVWKFLPAKDGAFLLDNNKGRSSQICHQSWLREAKSFFVLLQKKAERIFEYMTPLSVNAASLLAEAHKISDKNKNNLSLESHPGLQNILPDKIQISGLRSSFYLTKFSDHARIIYQRRKNYQQWLFGIQSIQEIHPLFSHLPEGVVPYAFPVLADSQGIIFHMLRLAGIPILRWEDMALSDCPVSSSYRSRLLQLPCHQDLLPEDIEWMVDTIRQLAMELNQ
ncbi:MAG TPA: DegT/DnrJ/EryC1/StrS family aminotransferase [Nitrosomonas europaea]|uniref:DegT/DnrJ/EryC1/StrS family aminotransferase n=1 Tax=Nitrosomonas europaea TaxID=915 RepID=UPI00248F97CF|nr:DegT/DnrJ/EryC1/StrS family aminotransferase [Nitrosomonas europaea]HRO56211.1 DegT/DnrJ/EryC1/StrS family aminotransferase [Nitrosomonas europaea]HUM73743.1 DegT/DnrJ/EryC1/StrS family aminotransferase [Nitrosomonas europaea]